MQRASIALGLCLAACGGSSPTTPSAPPTPSPPASPSQAVVVLRSAMFRGAHGHTASGTARIVQEGAEHRLDLLADFRVDTGSIDVYLARSQNTVEMTRDLNLGALRSRAGAQSFAMPNAGGSYAYVLLWCRPFRVPIGVGELR